MNVEKSATDDQTAEFTAKWSSLRDDFLQKPDWELFNEIEPPEEEEPDVVGGGIFLALLCTGGAGMVMMGKRRR